MRPDKRGSAASTTTLVVFALPVIWLGLIGGSCAAPGRTLIDWINAFGTAIEQPWHFSFNQYSLKAILIALAAYALCIMLYRDSQRKIRGSLSRRVGLPFLSVQYVLLHHRGVPLYLPLSHADSQLF